MMRLIKFTLLVFALNVPGAFSQTRDYKYRSKLTGVTDTWHNIVLPNHIYSVVKEDLNDIRIIGITETSDTIEVPYIINDNIASYETENVYPDITNRTHVGNRFFYTFENPSWESTNTINLNFDNENFDWNVKLEGSNNESTWYTILNNARILSIKNDHVDYSYSILNFPTVRYKYIRLSFNSLVKPELNNVSLSQTIKKKGIYQTYPPKSIRIKEDKAQKSTIIDVVLNQRFPVSAIQIDVQDKFDYYRPIEIQRLIDSIKTPKGWESYYEDLSEEYLSSLETGLFSFDYKLAQIIQIIISNYDNQHLNIGDITVFGNIINLTARFDVPAEYYLYYGNKDAYYPYYDISVFEDMIPENIKELGVGEEQLLIIDKEPEVLEPLINKYWLWSVMALIILLIGGFTIRMLKDSKEGA
jgi:hypothetical protein